mmetsp:Transcript_137449/g.293744  ORF Transcript_137449/g.293744 Transcript_137449/m.293744 type:complete len:248 (+) Transcript_137449:344-1087(+)
MLVHDLEGSHKAELEGAILQVEALGLWRRELLQVPDQARRKKDAVWIHLHRPVLLPPPAVSLHGLPDLDEAIGVHHRLPLSSRRRISVENGRSFTAKDTKALRLLHAHEGILVSARGRDSNAKERSARYRSRGRWGDGSVRHSRVAKLLATPRLVRADLVASCPVGVLGKASVARLVATPLDAAILPRPGTPCRTLLWRLCFRYCLPQHLAAPRGSTPILWIDAGVAASPATCPSIAAPEVACEVGV